jgi:hypothetical protein
VKRFCFPLAIALLVAIASAPAAAQSSDDGSAWRTLAEKLEGGITVQMQLRDGHRFKATFIGARDDTMVVQRNTRIPVPVEEIPYTSIASLSRVQSAALSGGKIAAIALGSAGAAIGAFFLILLASLD